MAASAPAPPAATKLAPAQRKSSRQTRKNVRSLVNAIAPATKLVLITKYIAIAPTTGFATAARSCGAIDPPSC